MVQKEVKKKTGVYATVAVLSALVLVSTVYFFGSVPIVFPPSETPAVSGMKFFGSMEELKTYLDSNSQGTSYGGGPLDSRFFGSSLRGMSTPAPQSLGTFGIAESSGTYAMDSYSTTNIQVAGVDEADTVKTDGRYIYTISSGQTRYGLYYYSYYPSATTNTIYIVNADPQNAGVVAKISLDNNTQPAGLFLSPDGNKLVVLASKYQMYNVMEDRSPYHSDVFTYINVYDISNKASPVLTRNFTASGSYFNSRMIGNYVYIVVSQPAAINNDIVTLPIVYNGEREVESSPSSVYYTDTNQSSYYTFTSFYGIDIADDQTQPTNITVMMDGASTMYVSPKNIYVTYPTWTEVGSYTSIYRVSIEGLHLSFEAKGSIPGNILNQYAMDEYSGNFRVATNWWSSQTQINNVYVLNENLTVIGKLEGLAQGENLHSVRFMGEKGYLVTFKKTDPLFVIDLSQAASPKVLGELKIPGYSDYLHPYDESHLIGVGKEAIEAQEGDFAWYQGVKLALFDISNVNNPTQISNYVIGDRGTDSPVLSDPKAFLFDKSKNLLVIPISLAIVPNKTSASDYGETVWQGAYVFILTTNGFTLKGTVTHLNPELLSNQGQISSGNYWNTQNDWINRSLYIGNTLYTISNGQIKLNDISNLSQISAVALQ